MKAPLNYKCIMICIVDRPETTQNTLCKFCTFSVFIYHFMFTKCFYSCSKIYCSKLCGNIFFLWRLLEYTMVTLIIGLFFNSLYPLHYLNKMILNYMGKDCKSAAPLEGPDSTIIYLSISYYVKHECTCWVNKDFLHPLEEPDFPSCVLQ